MLENGFSPQTKETFSRISGTLREELAALRFRKPTDAPRRMHLWRYGRPFDTGQVDPKTH